MKLKDIQSWALLPQFAEDAAFLQKAFDLIIKQNVERIKSLSQPLSIEAIHALTDDELQLLYDQYGVAEYYPDLDRSVRDMMLYNIVRYYRWLGTPKVMEILCKYIFNGFELEAIVWDNLAWDNGDLVHPELLDMYDVEVIPGGNVLPDNALYRILANIIRFSRNTQTLRDIWFTMPDNDISVSACIGLPHDTSGVVNIENYTICDPYVPPASTYYGYAYNLTPSTIRSTSSSYIHIYESDGTTAQTYDRAKQYTILHVWSASGVLADEYLPDLYFTPNNTSASALINLKLRTTSIYSSATIWRVEYTTQDL